MTSLPSSFSSQMSQATQLFGTKSWENGEEEKNKVKTALSDAYLAAREVKLESETLEQISSLFSMYGRLIYGGDMLQSLRNYQISIYGRKDEELISELFKKHKTFNDLQTTFTKHDETMEKRVSTDNPKEVSTNLLKEGDATAFEMAQRYRWMGHCYQNLKAYENKEHLPFFEKIYGTAQAILDGIVASSKDQKLRSDTNWEMCELHYNTDRFFYGLRYPNDPEGELATLDQLRTYLDKEGKTIRYQQKTAQILNIKMRGYMKLEKFDKGYDFLTDAIKIAEETEGFNPFLKAMFHSNMVSCALESGKTNYSELKEHADAAVTFAQKRKNNHFYFSGFYNNAAKIYAIFAANSALNHNLRVYGVLSYLYQTMSKTIKDRYPKS